jgi:tripeptide aminopeptidase
VTTTTAPTALDLFLELAAIVSPSQRERPTADRCAAYLRELGLAVDEDDAGPRTGGDTGNLYARIEPTTAGEPIFFCAHTDTVPAEGPIEPVIEGDWVVSGGDTILGADNKASVAAMLDGVRRVLADGIPHAGIEIVLTPQEETGLQGVRAFDASRLEARTGFVYDHAGPLGGIVMAAPGQNSISLQFEGQAAHAGIAPEEGRSAIAAAARTIAGLRLGRIDAETTANVGLIQGGVARNVVPASCVVEAEVRSRDAARLAEETAYVLEVAATAATVEGCTVATSVQTAYVPYRLKRTDSAVRLARAAFAATGIPVREEEVGGGADAHVFNEQGLCCVVLTSGMERIHGPGERILAADLGRMSDITVELIRAAAASGKVEG